MKIWENDIDNTATCGNSTKTIYTPVKDEAIIGGYWTDTDGNRINKALITDTVQFHLQTKNADGKKIRIRVFDANPIRQDTALLREMETTVSENQAVFEIKMEESLKQYVRDDRGNELELYCQCRFSDSDNIVAIGRDPSQYLYLYEVGYYRDDHCRVIVKVINGEIHWVPENSSGLTYRAFRNFVENRNNWTWTGNVRDVGVRDATLLGLWAWTDGEIINDKTLFRGFHRNPTQARIFTLNRSGNSPTEDDRQLRVVIAIAQSTGLPDRRVRERAPMTTAPHTRMRGGGGAVGLAVAAIVGTLEIVPSAFFMQDRRMVRQHLETLLSDVQNDIFSYTDDNRIPAHLNNWETIFQLSNLVLCGSRDTAMSDELFEMGKAIYRNYSEFNKG